MHKGDCGTFGAPSRCCRTDLKAFATNSIRLFLVMLYLHFARRRKFLSIFLFPLDPSFFRAPLRTRSNLSLYRRSDVLISSIQMGSVISYTRRRGSERGESEKLECLVVEKGNYCLQDKKKERLELTLKMTRARNAIFLSVLSHFDAYLRRKRFPDA